jgi:hypothetical protein
MTATPFPGAGPRAAARFDRWTWILGALALLTAANAAWMLVAPAHWYHELPADVPATGAYNEHFVRDIGCAFAVMAVALGWAALRPALRAPLTAIATLFLVAHAALHVFDSWRGYLPAGHWQHDVAGVYVPAVLAVLLTGALLRPRRSRPRPTEEDSA